MPDRNEVTEWAVMSETGLTIWVNLTKDEAEQLAQHGTEQNGRKQYAVPRKLADCMSQLYTEYHEASKRKLEADLKERTLEMLGAFDETAYLTRP